nr:hypothetical protein [Nocardioides agariphilus]
MRPGRRVGVMVWALVLVAGMAALAYAALPDAPAYVGESGGVAIAVAFTTGLLARTGGRTFVYGALATALGAAVVVTDEPVLRTGAAVLTCVVTAVFAVMATTPAATVLNAAREVVVAMLVGVVGAAAVVGLEPTVSLDRFAYTTLGASLALSLVVVYRLGAGLHGLGRRGLVAVVIGGGLLALTMAYAEVLRRYGAPDLVDTLLEGRSWALETLHGAPRPVQALLGVPALVWGTHMRARRRQGWWVCAFGVTAAAQVTHTFLDPTLTVTQAGLTTVYSVVLGIVIGAIVIRVDVLLTGSRRGRRARTGHEAGALRPEPGRTQPLL